MAPPMVSSTSPSGGASRVTAPTGPDAATSARPTSCIVSRRPGIYSPLFGPALSSPVSLATRDSRPPNDRGVLPSYHQQRQSVAGMGGALRPSCPDRQYSAMTDPRCIRLDQRDAAGTCPTPTTAACCPEPNTWRAFGPAIGPSSHAPSLS